MRWPRQSLAVPSDHEGKTGSVIGSRCSVSRSVCRLLRCTRPITSSMLAAGPSSSWQKRPLQKSSTPLTRRGALNARPWAYRSSSRAGSKAGVAVLT